MKIQTIIRTVALAVSTINALLLIWGYHPFPFAEDEVYAGISGVVEAVLIIWAWWKNNSITKTAQVADEVVACIKHGEITIDDIHEVLDSYVPKHIR
ncbi:MAG: phage holin [Coriobacteriia bacterium]|nr:phage holin [Coriobacteriia bacterium]